MRIAVRIAVRIEVGRDDDEGTTTGAGGVSRAVRIAVRIEAERDDDDAATTTWIVMIAFCGYRLWLPFVATDVATDVNVAAAPRCPHIQPPRRPHSRCSPPGAFTVVAAPQVPLRVLQPPRRPHNRCSPPSAPQSPAAPQAPSQSLQPQVPLTVPRPSLLTQEDG